MPAPVASHIAALTVIILGCAGCAGESTAPTLDLNALRQLSPENTAGIIYEESHGDLLVTVIDKHGDAHIHRLLPADLTQSQALELLRSKQAELEKHK